MDETAAHAPIAVTKWVDGFELRVSNLCFVTKGLSGFAAPIRPKIGVPVAPNEASHFLILSPTHTISSVIILSYGFQNTLFIYTVTSLRLNQRQRARTTGNPSLRMVMA